MQWVLSCILPSLLVQTLPMRWECWPDSVLILVLLIGQQLSTCSGISRVLWITNSHMLPILLPHHLPSSTPTLMQIMVDARTQAVGFDGCSLCLGAVAQPALPLGCAQGLDTSRQGLALYAV